MMISLFISSSYSQPSIIRKSSIYEFFIDQCQIPQQMIWSMASISEWSYLYSYHWNLQRPISDSSADDLKYDFNLRMMISLFLSSSYSLLYIICKSSIYEFFIAQSQIPQPMIWNMASISEWWYLYSFHLHILCCL